MKKKKRKHPITLIEIMIVILLIGLVGGALAFNMRGSMDEGRAFKTEQNIARVKDILTLWQLEEGPIAHKKWKDIVMRSPLAKGEATTKDGWNQELNVVITDDEITVTSAKLTAHYIKVGKNSKP